jgi:hypothetical protein
MQTQVDPYIVPSINNAKNLAVIAVKHITDAREANPERKDLEYAEEKLQRICCDLAEIAESIQQ